MSSIWIGAGRKQVWTGLLSYPVRAHYSLPLFPSSFSYEFLLDPRPHFARNPTCLVPVHAPPTCRMIAIRKTYSDQPWTVAPTQAVRAVGRYRVLAPEERRPVCGHVDTQPRLFAPQTVSLCSGLFPVLKHVATFSNTPNDTCNEPHLWSLLGTSLIEPQPRSGKT